MSFPSPEQAFQIAITQWEGLWEANPSDSGNYAHCKAGGTKLIGTMRGVTPDIYGAWINVDPCALTAQQMQQDVTLAVAAQIAVKDYYQQPGLDKLGWSPLIAITMDFGWTSGPSRAIKTLQTLVGATADGVPGPTTANLVNQYIARTGITTACDNYTAQRVDYYLSISQPGTPDAQFRQGWLNRANWFLSTNPSPCWWDNWRGWTQAVG